MQRNDAYGHGMGDQLLYKIGELLREETGADDVVGRYGGDEFIVMLYDIKDNEEAIKTAQRICEKLKTVSRRLNLTVNVSGSLGVSFTTQTGYDYRYLKEIADDRLYLAKKRGKNQIVKNF